jgi:dihydroorotase
VKLLIRRGHIVDPDTGLDGRYDILVDGETISRIARFIEEPCDLLIDAEGMYVFPGFIDMHVHAREPGFSYKETFETVGKAAAKGGVTTICAMPNTNPVIDNAGLMRKVMAETLEKCKVHFLQIGAMTLGQKGEEIADIEGMVSEGCVALSEDGKSVPNAALTFEIMKKANRLGIPILDHCEDKSLAAGGVMNADANAEKFGLSGIPNVAEDVIAARDILLAADCGAHLHLCHCSTRGSVRLVELAKAQNFSVSAEVCPHHFILSSDDISEDDGRYKMNPPLRSAEDVERLRRGLRNGTIEVIATDHAPHSTTEKNCSMKEAAFGVVGLETLACLTYHYLVRGGVLSIMQMAEKLSTNPARILGLMDRGSLFKGKMADLTIFDPSRKVTIDPDKFLSKGKSTPFEGMTVSGEVMYTIVAGKLAYEADK